MSSHQHMLFQVCGEWHTLEIIANNKLESNSSSSTESEKVRVCSLHELFHGLLHMSYILFLQMDFNNFFIYLHVPKLLTVRTHQCQVKNLTKKLQQNPGINLLSERYSQNESKPRLEFEQLSLGQRQDGRSPGAILCDTENRVAYGG